MVDSLEERARKFFATKWGGTHVVTTEAEDLADFARSELEQAEKIALPQPGEGYTEEEIDIRNEIAAAIRAYAAQK